MRRLLFSLVFLLLLFNVCLAENWRPVVPEDKSGEQKIQYDADSLKKVSDSITRVWLKAELKEQPTKRGASPVARAYYLIETNCQDRMYRILSTAEYSKDGRLINSSNTNDAPWLFIVPESTASYLYRVVCQK